LELRLLSKEGRGNYEFINSTIDNDFIESGAGGRVFGKQDVLSRLPSEHESFSFEAMNMRTQMLSDTVALNTFEAILIKHDTASRSYRSSVWVKEGNTWLMKYHQGTMLE
jgi:ribonuclease HI